MNHHLNTADAAAYMGVSQDFLKRARITGKGPVYAKIGKKVIYRLRDLDAFVEKNIRLHNSGVSHGQ